MSSQWPEPTKIKFTPTTPETRESGLLGFLSLRYHELRLDGIALRRTAGGSPTLSYPERRGRSGQRHAVFRPVDNDARLRIEHTVLVALGFLPDEEARE